MAIDDRGWRLVREETRAGPLQMALDEVAAETAADGGPRTLRVFRWRPSTLSLGYDQDPATVDWDYCEREGITVTRRPTGGGAIYHDEFGDVSYSIVAPADDLPGDLKACYDLLCEPLIDALEGMGLSADFADETSPPLHEPACYLRGIDPSHDLVVGGKKIAGNAQYRRRDAVVQHGSVTFQCLTRRHLDCFADPGISRAEFKERVTSVRECAPVDRDEAVTALEGSLADWADAEAGEWTDAELDRARELASEKYEDEGWVRHGEEPAVDREETSC